jgi:restriction endonuclease Mrr
MSDKPVESDQSSPSTSSKSKSTRSEAKPSPDKGGHYSFVDAAQVILEGNADAMHYHDISDKAIKQKLIVTEGKTPAISMYIAIRNDIERRTQTGQPQRFAFLGAGRFSIADIAQERGGKQEKTVFEKVSESRKEACAQLYQKLTSKNLGDSFELMVSDLLRKMGYDDVEVIGGKDDQGVDIICSRRDGISKTRIAMQCKCKALKNEIGPKDISNLRDNLSTYQCQTGVLITTSRLNDAAKAKAVEPGKERIHYIEHDELLDLFAQHQIGLKAQPVVYYQISPDQYEFLK